MRKPLLFLALCTFLALPVLLAAWSPGWDKKPRIPMDGLYSPGFGRCLALYEGDTLIGITLNRGEDMHKADKNRDAYAIATYNMAALVAQNAGRPDLASKLVELKITDGPELDSSSPSQCWCENTIWNGDPRKGGTVTGCGGPCGSCTHCRVKSAQ